MLMQRESARRAPDACAASEGELTRCAQFTSAEERGVSIMAPRTDAAVGDHRSSTSLSTVVSVLTIRRDAGGPTRDSKSVESRCAFVHVIRSERAWCPWSAACERTYRST